ncbi:MAG: glycosyltransferase [Polaribacter sp.]
MKFAIITHAIHKVKEVNIYAYEPYVREMNLWAKYVGKIKIVAPISIAKISKIDDKYLHNNVSISKIPSFNILTISNQIKSLFLIPIIFIKILKAMSWADHIHLRCPGNIGLLGCFVQIFFPFKPKTVKYAGNWDPKSDQPLSYRIQKWILSNTFLTKNCKVLVYGKWEHQSKNIVPFFTASYAVDEITEVPKKDFSKYINFIFVGAFSKGKQPMLSVKTIENLLSKNYHIQLDMFGNGEEFEQVKEYIKEKSLEKNIFLHGNKTKEDVKKAYQGAHFLLFISKSEGWPKVVAEAMFWKCLPISTKVSCVEFMVDKGNRGILVNADVNYLEISERIEVLINDEKTYQKKVLEAQLWSQKYTLNKFESEIKKLLN